MESLSNFINQLNAINEHFENNFFTPKENTMIEQLKAERKRQKISRAAIAPKLGVTEATLFNWESGKNDITFGKFLDYAKLLGIQVTIEFENEQNNKVNQALQVIERLTELKLPKSLNDRDELSNIYKSSLVDYEGLWDEEIYILFDFNNLGVWFDYLIDRNSVIRHFYTTNSNYEALVDSDYLATRQEWVHFQDIEISDEDIFDYLVQTGKIANYLEYEVEE